MATTTDDAVPPRRRNPRTGTSRHRRSSIASYTSGILSSLIHIPIRSSSLAAVTSTASRRTSNSNSISTTTSSARPTSEHKDNTSRRSSGYIDRELITEARRSSEADELLFLRHNGASSLDSLCASWRSRIEEGGWGKQEKGRPIPSRRARGMGKGDPWALPPLEEMGSLGSGCL